MRFPAKDLSSQETESFLPADRQQQNLARDYIRFLVQGSDLFLHEGAICVRYACEPVKSCEEKKVRGMT